MGISQSRGESLEQEDTFAVGSLDLPTRELRKNLRDSDNTDAVSWRPHRPGDREPTTQQVCIPSLASCKYRSLKNGPLASGHLSGCL